MKIETVQFFLKYPDIKFNGNSSSGSRFVSFIKTDGRMILANLTGGPQGRAYKTVLT
jgi:hypothetical protein